MNTTLDQIKKYDGTGLFSDDVEIFLKNDDVIEYRYCVVGTESISEPVKMTIADLMKNKSCHGTSSGTIRNYVNFNGHKVLFKKGNKRPFVVVSPIPRG